MANEQALQVAQDGTGRRIRNLAVTFVTQDPVSGVENQITALMQVVAIADADGIPLMDHADWRAQMLTEQKRIRRCLQALVDGELGADNFDPDVNLDLDDKDGEEFAEDSPVAEGEEEDRS